MSTILQKNLAREIVENLSNKDPKNKKEMLVSAGYDETTASASPSRTIEQQGVQNELIALGFTEEKAKTVVAEIMNNDELDPSARLKAADMTFKVHGSYAPDKSLTLNLDIAELDEDKIKAFNEWHKQQTKQPRK